MDTIREMMDYVGFGEADGEALRALLPFADPVLPVIAERFYDAIDRSPGARRVFVNDAQIERLKVSMQRWLRQLLEGPWDTAYWERRRSIGRTHVRVGLPERYMFTAMNLLRAELVDIARKNLKDDRAWVTCHAVARVCDLELAVMCSTFMGAHEDQRLRSLQDVIIRSLPITVLCLDREGLVTAATRPSARIFGAGAEIGSSIGDFLPADLIEASRLVANVQRAQARGHEVSVPRVVLGEGPAARVFRVNIVPLSHELAEVLVHVEELTDAVQAEARAQQAESLARIGSLAATLAHEIRNPLTAISATLQVIGGTLDESDRRRAILGKVQEQVFRLDRLVSDLLGYAKPAVARMDVVPLESLCAEAISSAAVPAELSVLSSVSVWADAQLVTQILVNLLQNARDAVGAQGQVIMVVGPGPQVEVIDSGAGVPASQRARIFDAFVTTKIRGTGLGLAICRKFATAMGAVLSLEDDDPSRPLRGACFRLSLQGSPSRTSPSDTGGYNG